MSPVPPPHSPQKALTFEDVAVSDTKNDTMNEWASLTPHKSLCNEVMLENTMHVVFLGYVSKLKRYRKLVERLAQAVPLKALPPNALPPNAAPSLEHYEDQKEA